MNQNNTIEEIKTGCQVSCIGCLAILFLPMICVYPPLGLIVYVVWILCSLVSVLGENTTMNVAAIKPHFRPVSANRREIRNHPQPQTAPRLLTGTVQKGTRCWICGGPNDGHTHD